MIYLTKLINQLKLHINRPWSGRIIFLSGTFHFGPRILWLAQLVTFMRRLALSKRAQIIRLALRGWLRGLKFNYHIIFKLEDSKI